MDIAKRRDRSVPQVVLRWLLQRGIASVPKSVTPAYISSNNDIWNFELTPQDMQEISTLNCGMRLVAWVATAVDPEYPFKDELPAGFKGEPAPTATK